jgi:DTW domain-containing protein
VSTNPELVCPACGKPPPLCVCDGIVAIPNRCSVLILQHPQEKAEALGTARLVVCHLEDAVLAIGLSWPGLAAALGRPADPHRWAVLYLGSAKPFELAPSREILALDGKGQPLPDQEAALRHLQGIVVLDGSWSQAKTLWWRNPWVLKCRRIVLGPRQPSRYGALRREPRRDSLSTLEAVALLLSRIEDRPEIETALRLTFERLLQRYRDSGAGVPPAAGRARRSSHWRK